MADDYEDSATYDRLCPLWVCQLWRSTILNTPSLWNIVFLNLEVVSSKEVVKLYLTSPATLPLRVYDHSALGFSQNLLGTVPAHLQCRLRDLRICCLCSKELAVLSQPAPLLECLDLTFPFATEITGNPKIPILFNNETPRLRHLTLDWVMAWSGNTFSNLTHLCLSAPPHDHPRPSRRRCVEFLQLLKSSPALEVFLLHAAHHWIPGEC